MGNFSTSIAIKTKDLSSVVSFLKKKKRVSFVSKPYNDFIYLYDEKCDQDPKQIIQLCRKISSDIKCTVLAFNNHDDDLLNYWLFVNGGKIDQYDSAPGYFRFGEVRPPRGGDPQKLCSVFDCQDGVEKLGDILRKELPEDNSYFLAGERHQAICDILGLNFQLSALSFKLIDVGGIDNPDDFIEIGDTPGAQFKRKLQKAELKKELFKREGVLLNEIIDHSSIYSKPVWSFCPKTGRLYAGSSIFIMKNDTNLFYLEPNQEQTINPTSLTTSTTLHKLKIDNSGKYLALGHAAGNWKTELFDLNKGELILTIQHSKLSESVCFNNDSTRLYCLSDFLVCSSLPDLQIIGKISIPIGTTCMTLHPSGKFAVLGCGDSIMIVDLISFSTHPKLHLGKIQDFDAEPYSDYLNAFQTIIAGLPPDAKSVMLQQVRNSNAKPFSFAFSPDGTQLYMASSKGVWIYNWVDLSMPTTNRPEPVKVYTFLELLTDRILGYDQPDKIRISQSYYTYDVCFDAKRNLLIYSNINGTICYIDIRNKSQGILFECPGNPAITELEISPDERLLVCTAQFLSIEGQKVPASVQIWNYQELLKKANLI